MPTLNGYDVLGNNSLQQLGVGIHVVLRMIVAYIRGLSQTGWDMDNDNYSWDNIPDNVRIQY